MNISKTSREYIIAGEKEKAIFIRTIECRVRQFLDSVGLEECDANTMHDLIRWTKETKRKLEGAFVEWYDTNIKGTKLPKEVMISAPRQDHIYRKFSKVFSDKVCEVCGDDRVLNIAHIIPRAAGGPDEAWNLIRLCANHHYLFDNMKLNEQEWSSINWESKDPRAYAYVVKHHPRYHRRSCQDSP
jgi:5-methylcytosine-specific restriction endonuclease McrA